MPKPKKPTVEQLLARINELSAQLAEVKQTTGPTSAARRRAPGQPRAEVYYVLAGVPTGGMPPQAIAVAKILATAADTNNIPEAEAMELMEKAKESGKLRTIQGSWHIFQYYRPNLIGGNYLRQLTVE